MKNQQAKALGFTHHAELYGVAIWYRNDETAEVEAKNWILSYWIDFLIWVECVIGVNDYGFPIKIKEEL